MSSGEIALLTCYPPVLSRKLCFREAWMCVAAKKETSAGRTFENRQPNAEMSGWEYR